MFKTGTFPDVAGSLLWLEATHKPFYKSNTVGLKKINQDLGRYYALNRDRKLSELKNLSMTQVRAQKPGFPMLKAKAAECRHVMGFLVLLARRQQFGDSTRPPFSFRPSHRLHARVVEHRALVTKLFEAVMDWQHACAAEPYVAANCKVAMYQYLTVLSALNGMWRDGLPDALQRLMPWHIRPKCHLLQHLVEEQLECWQSPNNFHCYADEDFVGCCKKVAMTCKHPASLERRIIDKARLLSGVDAYYAAHPEATEVPDDLFD